MRGILFSAIILLSGLSLASHASEATPVLAESPYVLLAHESGMVFRLSRRTGHVWVEVNAAWKLIPTNTAFTLFDIQRPYPFTFQLVGSKSGLMLMNSSDGRSQFLTVGGDPASFKFVDVAEPK